MRFVAKTFFLLMAGIGAMSCVIIVFIQEAFGSATKGLSIMTMTLGLGCFVSSVVYGRFGQAARKDRAILLSLPLTGIFIIMFALSARFTPHIFASGIIMFFIGVASGPVVVLLNTMVHEAMPQETRGRIFSSLEVVIHLAFLLSMFAAAFFAERIGKAWVLVFCGFFFLLWGIAGIIGGKDGKRWSSAE
jgi:MFS family permease